MKQDDWFSLKDLGLIEDSDTIVDVLFENGNIVQGKFYSYIEWFRKCRFGTIHLKHHMFQNNINNKSTDIENLTIVGWKFIEREKHDC